MAKSIFENGIGVVAGVVADTVHYQFIEEGIRISDIKNRGPINEAVRTVLNTFSAVMKVKEFSSPDVRKVRALVEKEIMLRVPA